MYGKYPPVYGSSVNIPGITLPKYSPTYALYFSCVSAMNRMVAARFKQSHWVP